MKNHKKTLAGIVRHNEYKLMLVITSVPAAVLIYIIGQDLWKEGFSVLSSQDFWILFAIAFFLLLVFWRYFRYSILYSEKQKAFIVNTMFSHRTYYTADITSIQITEIRRTVGPQLRGLGNREVHDDETNLLLIQCGRRRIYVNRSDDGVTQFIAFLQKTTPTDIWQEVSRVRTWSLLDLFVSSKEDPWEIARKEQKRKKKTE